mgnify:FL=1
MKEEYSLEKKKKLSLKKIIVFAAALIVIVVLTLTLVVPNLSKEEETQPVILTTSTLQKIINVRELSTCSSVYNGIAQVNNPDKPAEVNYYVAYEAKIKAGFDLDKVTTDIKDVDGSDGKSKLVIINIPKIKINETEVDIASLDFMFLNNSANTSTVTEEAYKACKLDAESEAADQQAIYDLAKQNAESVIKALVQPILEQVNEEHPNIHYDLKVNTEE